MKGTFQFVEYFWLDKAGMRSKWADNYEWSAVYRGFPSETASNFASDALNYVISMILQVAFIRMSFLVSIPL